MHFQLLKFKLCLKSDPQTETLQYFSMGLEQICLTSFLFLLNISENKNAYFRERRRIKTKTQKKKTKTQKITQTQKKQDNQS